MMKKLFSALLACAMLLSLAACGSGTKSMTVDEMLDQSESIGDGMSQLVYTDPAAAKEKYGGTMRRGFYMVGEIQENCAILFPMYSDGPHMVLVKAELPAEELERLQPGQSIQAVGQFGKEITEVEYADGLYQSMELAPAHVSMETMIWTGRVWDEKDDYGENVYSFEFSDSVVLHRVYFREDQEVPYEYGANGPELRVSGVELYGDTEQAELHDAVILEVTD